MKLAVLRPATMRDRVLARNIGRAIALTEAMRDACQRPWQFIPMGEFQLKGQSRPCPIYSLQHTVVGEFHGHERLVGDMEDMERECQSH